MTPADELSAAAKLIRERAERAGVQRWTVTPPEKPGNLHLIQGEDWAVARSAEYEAPYIALMHPGVGLAVADWLDQTAADDEYGEVTGFDKALAVARACLGTSESGEPADA